MPNKQPKIPRLKRFTAWVRRHKVLSVLCALILAVLIYFGVSGLVWQLEVHSERNRYMQTSRFMDNIAQQISKQSGANVHRYNVCSYTDNGLFTPKQLGCEISLSANYPDISQASTLEGSNKIKQSLLNANLILISNDTAKDPYDLSVYNFEVKNIKCYYSATWYGNNVPSTLRYKAAVQTGSAAYVSIGCGGPAKAKYFPVTSD